MKRTIKLVVLMFFIGNIFVAPLSGAVTIDDPSSLSLSLAKELAVLHSPDIKKQEVAVDLAEANERDAEAAYYQAMANNPMFMATATNTYNAAKDATEDSKVSLANLKIKIGYDVEKLYLDILNIESSIETIESTYDMQEKLVKLESLKVQLGLSTKYDQNEVLQKTRDIKRQLDNLYNNKEKLVWQMNRMIGRKPEVLLTFAEVTFNPVEIGTQSEVNTAALQTSLTLKQFNRTIEDKNIDLDAKRAQSDKAEKLEVEIKNIELQKNDLEYNIKLALENAYEQMDLNVNKLSDYRIAYDLEKEKYENQKLKYKLGLIGKITLDSSEIALNQKFADFEKAVHDYYLLVRKIELAEKGIII